MLYRSYIEDEDTNRGERQECQRFQIPRYSFLTSQSLFSSTLVTGFIVGRVLFNWPITRVISLAIFNPRAMRITLGLNSKGA